MKQATLPLPEIGLIAATRGIAGAGAALLLADRMTDKRRKAIGWPLFLVGALSTIPLMLDIRRRMQPTKGKEEVPNLPNGSPDLE